MSESIVQYLQRSLSKPANEWLMGDMNDLVFDANAFFSQPVVYYPGAGTDGQAVKLFNQAGVCHHYLYVDYGYERESLLSTIREGVDGFLGYDPIAFIEVTKHQLAPHGFSPSVRVDPVKARWFVRQDIVPFATMVVFQRQAGLTSEHGASRFAVLFLCADGIATFDALFCARLGAYPVPLAILLEDYGFGGQYEPFGAGWHMEELASTQGKYPRFLLVGRAKPWTCYSPVENVFADIGGMHSRARALYKRSTGAAG